MDIMEILSSFGDVEFTSKGTLDSHPKRDQNRAGLSASLLFKQRFSRRTSFGGAVVCGATGTAGHEVVAKVGFVFVNHAVGLRFLAIVVAAALVVFAIEANACIATAARANLFAS